MILNPWKKIAQLEGQLKAYKAQADVSNIRASVAIAHRSILKHDVKNVIASLDGVTNGTAIRVRRELQRAIEEAN